MVSIPTSITVNRSSAATTVTIAAAATTIVLPVGCECKSHPPIGPTTNPTSYNQLEGLEYAIQKHDFVHRGGEFEDFNVEFFKTAPPIQSGVTTCIGFRHYPVEVPISIYGRSPIRCDYIAINHRGYFIPPMTGEYVFSTFNVDDMVCLWLGDSAYNGKYTRANASLIHPLSKGVSTKKYRAVLTAGVHYPFRLILANAQGGASLWLTVTGPDGTVLLSKDVDSGSYFIQHSLSGASPPFQPFGQETL